MQTGLFTFEYFVGTENQQNRITQEAAGGEYLKIIPFVTTTYSKAWSSCGM